MSFVSDEWLEAIAVGVEVRVPGAQTYLSGSKRPVRTVTYGNGEGQAARSVGRLSSARLNYFDSPR